MVLIGNGNFRHRAYSPLPTRALNENTGVKKSDVQDEDAMILFLPTNVTFMDTVMKVTV